jgi:hypothetical protein
LYVTDRSHLLFNLFIVFKGFGIIPHKKKEIKEAKLKIKIKNFLKDNIKLINSF